MERRVRRRSTSLGDGDMLSSTIDMPQASSTNRLSNFNNDRCVSTPHINVTVLLMIPIGTIGGHGWKGESKLGQIRVPVP